MDPAGTKLCVAAAGNEASMFEHLDVFGDRRQREIERRSQLVHTGFAISETGKDRSSSRVRKRCERLIEPCIIERCCCHIHLQSFRTGYLATKETSKDGWERQDGQLAVSR